MILIMIGIKLLKFVILTLVMIPASSVHDVTRTDQTSALPMYDNA